MAAGLGYKEFATGDVLTAADANGYLASQVVMVFASAAARTSAITSPQEGMISFLKDTNSTEYYSGSAWVAIGGSSGALTLVRSQSFTSASSVDLSDIFSSTYDNYLILGNYQPSVGADLQYRYRVGGADNSTSNYNYQAIVADGTSMTAARGTSLTLGTFQTGAGDGRSTFSAQIFNPFLTQTTNALSAGTVRTSSTMYRVDYFAGFNATTSFTGLTLIASTGNVTGTVRIYGIANA